MFSLLKTNILQEMLKLYFQLTPIYNFCDNNSSVGRKVQAQNYYMLLTSLINIVLWH